MSPNNNLVGIPEPSLRRLPLYHDFLKKLLVRKINNVSCTQIAEALNLLPVQIRKDLAYTGVIGKPKVGYEIKELIHHLEKYLGWNNMAEAVLAGVGNLGMALLGYQGFQQYGLNITAAFDSDPDKIGKQVLQKKILNISKLPDLVQRLKIKIGILTVSGNAAQEIADLMISSGIEAIWNFTPSRLQVPDNIIVQHENLAASLSILSNSLISKNN